MLRRVLGAVLLCGVALAGCTAHPGQSGADPPERDRAHSLWLDRTAYVGDNSKVIALAEGAGLGSMGSMTLRLDTDAPPYGLTVAYDSVGKPFETVDFTPQATLMLGLVGNLERVEVTSGDRSHTFTSAEVSRQLGYDVKTLARDEAKLRDYLESLDD
ncbi:MAG TPA: DUF4825 domain-containing protein [Dermatophilaceae bacterium]|nr:DUF4825 domain-containing protein [Dermatophilaceae bacterium]